MNYQFSHVLMCQFKEQNLKDLLNNLWKIKEKLKYKNKKYFLSQNIFQTPLLEIKKGSTKKKILMIKIKNPDTSLTFKILKIKCLMSKW